ATHSLCSLTVWGLTSTTWTTGGGAAGGPLCAFLLRYSHPAAETAERTSTATIARARARRRRRRLGEVPAPAASDRPRRTRPWSWTEIFIPHLIGDHTPRMHLPFRVAASHQLGLRPTTEEYCHGSRSPSPGAGRAAGQRQSNGIYRARGTRRWRADP